ncbi:peptidyl-trna hydrolase ii [Malassezia pachydermatis]|uniref:peptidyl-tRNA hydrolase n=1 Tax=Malassezia pachydermatis TaxID=77020 RepID=A0A0M9VR54_9BASI|nr:peptidyl-trna hydrolase ii [Malassezia pachydermatis]KOS16223.1 peptidyl-trna hydrolase ii [Malassezia pachydermatis]
MSTHVQPLVMQIIVDRDLVKQPEWTTGPLMAQAAHAATAALAESWMHENTRAYVSTDNLPHMHKIVLQTPKGVTLTALSEQLRGVTEPDMPTHYLWTEQPENVPTCLAIAPNRKPACLTQILKKCTLLRS